MKSMKYAILCAASFVAISTTARADELADLKADVAALTAQLAQLSTAQDVPAGYKLLTQSKSAPIVVPGFEEDKNYLPSVNTIGIRPTADLPEAANLQWSGFVRAGAVYSDVEITSSVAEPDPDAETHILARGELKLVATNDTAVGEVGTLLKLRGDFDGGTVATVGMPVAWGWWKMTNELTFGGGYTGSLGTVGHGADHLTAMYSDGVDTVAGLADTTQFSLNYSSGPFGVAAAVTHSDEGTDDDFGAAGEITFTSDNYSAEVAGFIHDDNWEFGGGLTARVADTIKLSAAAGMGHSGDAEWLPDATVMTSAAADGDVDYWLVSLFASADLSDSVSAELGYSYKDSEGTTLAAAAMEERSHKVAGGLYFTPVSQLTLGVEGSYYMTDVADVTNAETLEADAMIADFVSVFRF